MKLLTKAIEKSFEANPLYSHENDRTPKILVKFFNPTGVGTWLITEASKTEEGDWRMFGMCEIHEKELGYVMLSELASFRGQFGLGIERDMYFEGRLNTETLEVVR